jgi:uncharacterized protein
MIWIGILIGVLAVIGVYFYVYFRRMIGWLRKKKGDTATRLLSGFCAGGAALLTLNMRSIWAIVMLHLFGFALCMELVHAVIRWLTGRHMGERRPAGRYMGERRPAGRHRGRRRTADRQMSGRRKTALGEENSPDRWDGLYRCGIIPILCTALTVGYGYWNMNHVIRTDYRIKTEKDIRDQGYVIALVSDLHYGTTMGAKKLREYADIIQDASADMVVLCGDMVDEGTTREQMEEAMGILGSIQSPMGTLFVHGNHDKTRYAGNPNFTAEQLEDAVRNAGIRILADQKAELPGGLQVVGRDDRSFPRGGRRKSIEELTEDMNQDKFILLLDHQPCELEAADRAGCDLMLSGHTHAGQIWPSGLISQGTGMVELNYGYRMMNHLQVIVSSGIAGWAYPVRTSKHCEYVIVTVERAE